MSSFITQRVKKKTTQFETSKDKPNKILLKALKEAEKMEKHPEKYKGYHNMYELIDALKK